MKKLTVLFLVFVLLLPALFVFSNPSYSMEDQRNIFDGDNYANLFDASRQGYGIERPLSYSLMDYSPTYYNWFDITNEYTAFPTLGDPIGSGNSTVQPGEIPLVPMDTDIRYDNVLASFSAERNDLATYILYHDSAYIYSVIITHSLYDMTKVYAFEADPADSGILIIDIVNDEGTDSPGLVHVDCRADFHDVVFTTVGNADLFFYRMSVVGDTARYMVFVENVGTENIILIKAGAKVYSGDMSSPYPTPSWFSVFGTQTATVTYDEDYIAGNTTIPAFPTFPTAPTYNGTTRVVNWALGDLISPEINAYTYNYNVTSETVPSNHEMITDSTSGNKYLTFSSYDPGKITFYYLLVGTLFTINTENVVTGSNNISVTGSPVRYTTTADIYNVCLLTITTTTPAVYNTTGDHKTIQSAIDASSAGDIVQVMDGTYVERITNTKAIKLLGVGNVTVDISTGSGILSLNNMMLENIIIDHNLNVGSINLRTLNSYFLNCSIINYKGVSTHDRTSLNTMGGGITTLVNCTFANNIQQIVLRTSSQTLNIISCTFNTPSADGIRPYAATNNHIINICDSNVNYSIGIFELDAVIGDNVLIKLINSSVSNIRGNFKVITHNSIVDDYNIDTNGYIIGETITANTITLSGTASLTADSVIATTVTVAETADYNVGWTIIPSGTIPINTQAVHDDLLYPAILDGASSIPGGTEYSFTITEMKTLGAYDSDMEVLYHGFPMDITEITDLKSHDQLQTIIYYNGGFMCYEGGEWVITYNVTGADRTAWETRDGFTLMGFDANKAGDAIEFYVTFELAGNVPSQFQFKDSSTYNVFTSAYYFSMLNTTVTGIGNSVYYHWWEIPSPGYIMYRGYNGYSHYTLDRDYNTGWYLGAAFVVYFIDNIMPKIDGLFYAGELRLAGESPHLFNVYITQKDIIYQKSGVNVTIPNAHITYRTGELTAYVKNANFTSYTVTASNLSTVTATHGGDIPMGFLTVTESYMFYSDNTFMVFTDEGVLIRAAQLPGVNVAVGEDTVLVFEGNYRYLTVTYGEAYLINFGKSMTLIAPNGTVTIYHFTEAFSINTIRVFDDVNASGFYINGVIYLETEFVGGGDLYISTLYDFGYSLYDTSATEFFDTSYLKLSGNLYSQTVAAFTPGDFSRMEIAIGSFASGRFYVTMGDLVLDVRRDGLNYRFTFDGHEILIRSTNQDYVISVTKTYEVWSMTVTPVRIIGSDYTPIGNTATLSWIEYDDHSVSSIAVSFNAAEARIYDLFIATQRQTVLMPDYIMTNESNLLTGDGIRFTVQAWAEGGILSLDRYELKKAGAYIDVRDTVTNVTVKAPYSPNMAITWDDDGLIVNGRLVFANSTVPDALIVNGYFRYSAASELLVSIEQVPVVNIMDEPGLDVQQYALWVLIATLFSLVALGFLAQKMGYGLFEVLGTIMALLFVLLAAVTVLGAGL